MFVTENSRACTAPTRSPGADLSQRGPSNRGGLLLSCALEIIRNRAGRLGQELFVDDQVAAEDRTGLVAGDLHGDGLLDSGADEIPDRGAAEVVQQSIRHAR